MMQLLLEFLVYLLQVNVLAECMVRIVLVEIHFLISWYLVVVQAPVQLTM